MADPNVFGVLAEDPAAPETVPAPEATPQPVEAEPEAQPQAALEAVDGPAAGDEPVVSDEGDEAEFLAEGEEGVKLGNKVYRDWAAADHVFRQFAGRAKAESRRRKDTEAELAQARVELSVARQATPLPVESPAPHAPAPAPKRLSELIVPEEIDSIIAEKSPAAAFQRMAELIEARVGELVDERTKDIQPVVNRAKAVDAAAELFEGLSNRADAAGNRAIPELDPEDPRSDMVVAQWRENLNDPALRDIAFTEAAVVLALNQVRLAQASHPQPASPKPAGRKAAAALVGMSGGVRQPTSAGPTRPADLEEAARLAVKAREHPVFGVIQERT